MAKIIRAALIFALAAAAITLSELALPTGFWHVVLHEGGVALLVSLIVWGLFELHVAAETEGEWSKRIERVTQNVFMAVLRKDLPKGLIDEANTLVLNSALVRSAFSITYTLADATFDLPKGGKGECVTMAAVVSFRVENVSTEAQNWTAGLRLPNPVHSGMKELSRVNGLTVIKHGKPMALDLGEAEKRFRERMRSSADAQVPFHVALIPLEPREVIEVRADYVMAKECEDSEFLETLLPCDGLTVTVMDQSLGTARSLFARSVHRRPLDNQSSPSSPGTKIYRIRDYLLPHQGVVIWWKRNSLESRP